MRLNAKEGHLVEETDMDVIVNAVGTDDRDKEIFKEAGPRLQEEFRRSGHLYPGVTKTTDGYRLPFEKIIHVLSPLYIDGRNDEKEILESCYYACLREARRSGFKKIAFPPISTGDFNFPATSAAKVAIKAVKDFNKEYPGAIDEVEWVCRNKMIAAVYLKEIKKTKEIKYDL